MESCDAFSKCMLCFEEGETAEVSVSIPGARASSFLKLRERLATILCLKAYFAQK